ncbi:hypothetical protein V1477_002798 [Vespula maculifrons]|uniref:Transmembrane protein n=1 Tax=Vespula maculifrons TaxID=7453 RepID=A0ABD2CVL4_VESMC
MDYVHSLSVMNYYCCLIIFIIEVIKVITRESRLQAVINASTHQSKKELQKTVKYYILYFCKYYIYYFYKFCFIYLNMLIKYIFEDISTLVLHSFVYKNMIQMISQYFAVKRNIKTLY